MLASCWDDIWVVIHISWSELGSSWLGGWFRGTQAREHAAWRVPDRNRSAIGVGQWLTTCIANVYRKKTLSIVRKLCKFCMRTIFVIFNLCNDWRICSIEYSVRFAHTAHVCRWRSKPIRALVKGSEGTFVGHVTHYVSNYIVCWTRN